MLERITCNARAPTRTQKKPSPKDGAAAKAAPTTKAAPPTPAAPVAPPAPPVKKTSFRVSFVFPKVRGNPGEMFMRLKPQIYYALGTDVVVEMNQAEGPEAEVFFPSRITGHLGN